MPHLRRFAALVSLAVVLATQVCAAVETNTPVEVPPPAKTPHPHTVAPARTASRRDGYPSWRRVPARRSK